MKKITRSTKIADFEIPFIEVVLDEFFYILPKSFKNHTNVNMVTIQDLLMFTNLNFDKTIHYLNHLKSLSTECFINFFEILHENKHKIIVLKNDTIIHKRCLDLISTVRIDPHRLDKLFIDLDRTENICIFGSDIQKSYSICLAMRKAGYENSKVVFYINC